GGRPPRTRPAAALRPAARSATSTRIFIDKWRTGLVPLAPLRFEPGAACAAGNQGGLSDDTNTSGLGIRGLHRKRGVLAAVHHELREHRSAARHGGGGERHHLFPVGSLRRPGRRPGPGSTWLGVAVPHAHAGAETLPRTNRLRLGG